MKSFDSRNHLQRLSDKNKHDAKKPFFYQVACFHISTDVGHDGDPFRELRHFPASHYLRLHLTPNAYAYPNRLASDQLPLAKLFSKIRRDGIGNSDSLCNIVLDVHWDIWAGWMDPKLAMMACQDLSTTRDTP
jgi:hypothetical protein